VKNASPQRVIALGGSTNTGVTVGITALVPEMATVATYSLEPIGRKVSTCGRDWPRLVEPMIEGADWQADDLRGELGGAPSEKVDDENYYADLFTCLAIKRPRC